MTDSRFPSAPGDESWLEEVEEIQRRRVASKKMGGDERVARQHDRGRLAVRERLDLLVDPGTLREIAPLSGTLFDIGHGEEFLPNNYVAGMAQVDGRWICVGGEDATIAGGTSVGRLIQSKSRYIEDMALTYRRPMVWLIEGAGASVRSYEANSTPDMPTGAVWPKIVELSGVVPLVSAIMGPIAGAPAGLAALTHFTTMVSGNAQVFAAGPPVVNRALGSSIDKEELGGVDVHAKASGVVDNVARDESHALEMVKQFLSYLPPNCWELPPVQATSDPLDRRDKELLSIVPKDRTRPYAMMAIVRSIVDQDGGVFQFQPDYGPALITCFARVGGESIGIIANNPMVIAGAVDGPAADKFSHFVQLCNTFNLPLLFLVDTPGFMVGRSAERTGVLHRGMRAVMALQQAVVPQLSIVIRKCYGIAGGAMGSSPSLTRRLAWPSGEWGSLPIEGGVSAAFRREIEESDDPVAHRTRIEDRLRELRSPFRGAEAFVVEDLIDPRDTRRVVADFIEVTRPARETLCGPKTFRGVMP